MFWVVSFWTISGGAPRRQDKYLLFYFYYVTSVSPLNRMQNTLPPTRAQQTTYDNSAQVITAAIDYYAQSFYDRSTGSLGYSCTTSGMTPCIMGMCRNALRVRYDTGQVHTAVTVTREYWRRPVQFKEYLHTAVSGVFLSCFTSFVSSRRRSL